MCWGEPEDEELPKAVVRCRNGEAMVTCCPAKVRRGDEEMPRSLKKDTLPAPRAPSTTPWPQRGDFSPHSSPVLLQVQPAVPRCLEQAGPGKRRRWLWNGHPELPTAAPKAPPAAGEASLNCGDLAGLLGTRSPGRSPGSSQSGPGSAHAPR